MSTSPVQAPLLNTYMCVFLQEVGRSGPVRRIFYSTLCLGRPLFFLFVLSAFSGPSLTPQLCEHNLLPPSETSLMLRIPWAGRLPRAASLPAHLRPAWLLAGAFTQPSSAPVPQSSKGLGRTASR